MAFTLNGKAFCSSWVRFPKRSIDLFDSQIHSCSKKYWYFMISSFFLLRLMNCFWDYIFQDFISMRTANLCLTFWGSYSFLNFMFLAHYLSCILTLTFVFSYSLQLSQTWSNIFSKETGCLLLVDRLCTKQV